MNKTIQIIRYLRYYPMSSTEAILRDCSISEAGFYRHKKHARRDYGVEIEFLTRGNNSGHDITRWGIIDRYAL